MREFKFSNKAAGKHVPISSLLLSLHSQKKYRLNFSRRKKGTVVVV